MFYYKTAGGFIASKRVIDNGIEITEEEFNEAKKIAEAEPTAEAEDRKYWTTVSYGEAVDTLFRKKYLQRDAEAVINNYLADPTNKKYVAEMQEMQDYREWCKVTAKEQFAKYGRQQ